jgi:hypothetical protein
MRNLEEVRLHAVDRVGIWRPGNRRIEEMEETT